MKKDGSNGQVWNLLNKKNQQEVIEQMMQCLPDLVVASPPCTMFSQMRRINNGKLDQGREDEKMKEAVEMLEFGVRVCKEATRLGLGFVFERPWGASSWSVGSVRQLSQRPEVEKVMIDMCRFGLKGTGQWADWPVKKPTTLLTNIATIMNNP